MDEEESYLWLLSIDTYRVSAADAAAIAPLWSAGKNSIRGHQFGPLARAVDRSDRQA